MASMFRGANVFNSNISDWNTSNATIMSAMFANARTFNQNLTSWCVSKIPYTPGLFKDGSAMPTDGSYDPKWGTCP